MAGPEVPGTISAAQYLHTFSPSFKRFESNLKNYNLALSGNMAPPCTRTHDIRCSKLCY